VFVDLGMSPPSNAFLTESQISAMERFYPLCAYVCGSCFLVQLDEFESPAELFSDYVYFSSYSASWLRHCEEYARTATARLGLNEGSLVVEVASNDGYLLQFFSRTGIPVLGIEPAANVAHAAIEKGIPTEIAFLTESSAHELRSRGVAPDLVVANNVLAHVPDINGFVEAVRVLLLERGVATFEFPHLLELIRYNQFDTVYHEHFSYLSLATVQKIFAAHDLTIFRVERLPTHGGSLRVWVDAAAARPQESSVAEVSEAERAAGLDRMETYPAFGVRVEEAKRRLLEFLIEAKDAGAHIAGYGAAAKGTTLLNYCGVRGDFIDYIVDANPHKQGRFLPGCHIPVRHPSLVAETRPDYLLILPWNLRAEIEQQMSHIRTWGGKFVVPIPRVQVF
jgi:2-polyprenyl-3-methyl-5-hydroxy-6-metoxy-1,4-benzoquinol methylase